MRKWISLVLILCIAMLQSCSFAEGSFDTIKKTSGDAEYMKEVMQLIVSNEPTEGAGWPNSTGVAVCVSALNRTIKIGAHNATGERVYYSWEFGENNLNQFIMAWIVLLAEFEKIDATVDGSYVIISTDDASVFDNADEALKLASGLYGN